MRWPQPSMCRVPRSTCTLHVTLCTKCEFLPFWNRIITIKMWGESRFNLTDGYLWLWSFVPSSQKWIRLTKLPSYFSFKTPSFPQFSIAVARCYNGWNLNNRSFRNARRAGLKTSSASKLWIELKHSPCPHITKLFPVFSIQLSIDKPCRCLNMLYIVASIFTCTIMS